MAGAVVWGIPGCRRSNDSQGARSHWIQSTVTEKDSHSKKNQKDSACSHWIQHTAIEKKTQHPNIKTLLLKGLSQCHCCANVENDSNKHTLTQLRDLFSHNMICGSLCCTCLANVHQVRGPFMIQTNHSIDRSRWQMKILPEKETQISSDQRI